MSEKLESGWLVFNVESRVYWKADRCGYTVDVEKAGRYTLVEALKCAALRSREHDYPPELVVLSPEAIRDLTSLAAQGTGAEKGVKP